MGFSGQKFLLGVNEDLKVCQAGNFYLPGWKTKIGFNPRQSLLLGD
jgi:hypothetical protein